MAWTLQRDRRRTSGARVVLGPPEGELIPQRRLGLSRLPAHVASSRAGRAALQRDFAQLRALDHPHIARLLELVCDGEEYYVRAERLDGESLREVLTHLSPERLEIEEADDIVRAIGSALVYAHGQGVGHGDVRPENVLVTMDRRFLLTNFLSRRVTGAARRVPRRDDVAGLARLAAELYTGSPSPRGLRAATHSGVPAARLNAIRSVLETPFNQGSGNVSEFLAAAGLSFTDIAAGTARRSPGHERSSWYWPYVLPVGALIALGTFVVSYYAVGGDWRASLVNMQRRSLEALQSVATRATPPGPSDATDAEGTNAEAADPDAAPSNVAISALNSAPGEADAAAPPDSAEAVAEPTVATTDSRTALASVGKTAAVPHDPTVLSMSVPRIAVREDHTVVVIEIVRSGDTTRETLVGWWIAPGTAEPDEDYATGGRQVVAFPPGATMQRVLIPIVDDRVREPNEVFTVHLSPPRNGVVGDVTSTHVTVYDDD